MTEETLLQLFGLLCDNVFVEQFALLSVREIKQKVSNTSQYEIEHSSAKP
jgi:hypothetical protein